MNTPIDTWIADSRLRRYGFAVFTIAAALIVGIAARSIFGQHPFLLFWPAVFLAVWFGGLGPGLFAGTLAVVVMNYFFLPPYNTFKFHYKDVIELSMFLALAAGVNLLFEARRRIEASVRVQSEWLRVTLGSIGDGVIATDAQGQVLFMNGIAGSLTGWPPGEAVGRSIGEVFHIVNEDTRERVTNPIRRALDEGTVVGLANHTVLIARDGAERCIDDSGAPIHDSRGRTVGAVLIFRDDTARRNAERDLRRAYHEADLERRRLQAVLDALPVGVGISDERGAILQFSKEVYRIWGAEAPTPDSIAEYREFKAWRPDTGELVQPEEWTLARALLQGKPIYGDILDFERFDTGERGTMFNSATPVWDAAGRVIGGVVASLDITELRRTQKALEKTLEEADLERRRLEAVLDAMPAGVSILNADGGILHLNRQYHRIWGGDAPLIGSIAEAREYRAWWPDTGELVKAEEWGSSRALLKGETSFGEVIDIQRFDGGRGTILNSAAPIVDVNGRIVGAVAALQDITDLRQAQARIEWMARFPGENPSPVMRVAADGTILYTNASSRPVLKAWGCEDSGCLPDTWRDLVVEALRTDVKQRIEVDVNVENGNRTISLWFSPIRQENWVNIYGHDVTDLKHTEAQLREASERLQFALQAANMTAWNWNRETDWVEYSSNVHDVLGLKPDYPISMAAEALRQYIRPEDTPLHRARVEEAMRRGGDFVSEVRFTRPVDSAEVWLESRGRVRLDDDGKVIRFGGVTIDITERKLIEQQRAELLEREKAARLEAERADEMKVTFLGMISHELRTPLTSIKGFATTLLADDVTFPPEDQRDFIKIISEESDRLAELIEQLLDLSRLHAGTMKIDPIPQSLARVIDAATQRLEMLATQHRLIVGAPDDLPPVRADARRIAQVLENLVGNAVKYAPPQTQIIVSARQREDGWVQVDVIDEGPGIPPEERESVFEAFRQGTTRTATQPRGAGLGLAICKGVIEGHGGRIWIGDRPACGAVVSFTLPLAE